MRILILNLAAPTAEAVSGALAGLGYETAVDSGLDVEQIETLNP